MAYWYSCFLFPGTRVRLNPHPIVDSFTKDESSIDPRAFSLGGDKEAHGYADGEEVSLSDEAEGDLASRLKALLDSGAQLEVSFHGREFYGGVCFEHRSMHPHIAISWHGPRFDRLGTREQETFFSLVLATAEEVGATHAVLAIEPPDSLGMSFQQTDAGPELRLDELSAESILEVWIIRANGGTTPKINGPGAEQVGIPTRELPADP